MKTRYLLLVLCLGLGLTGCLGQNASTPAQDTSAEPDVTESSTPSEQEKQMGTATQPALEGKRWILQTLNGKPVQTYPNQPKPNVVFATDNGMGRVSGSDGCNLLVGSYAAENAGMTFQHVGTTMMLCPGGADQSRAFLKALGDTSGWKLDGARLELRNNSGILAIFESSPL